VRERETVERERNGVREGEERGGCCPPLSTAWHSHAMALPWPHGLGGNASRWRSAQARGGRQSPQGGGEGEGCSVYVGGDDDVGLRKLEGEKEGGGCCGGVGGDLGG